MIDQAQKLRDLINKGKLSELNNEQDKESSIPSPHKKSAKVICVTSGKGGVGKSSFTVNSSILASNMGKKVVLFDADFGLANIDVLFGLKSHYNLSNVIDGSKRIEEILTTGPNGVKFISGGSGLRELIYLDKEMLNRFVKGIEELNYLADLIIVDTGAGISDNVVNFVLAADEIVVVITPEPTSITDGYALIKTIVNMEKGKSSKINIVTNRADNKNEADEVYEKLYGVCKRFLNYELHDLGHITFDNHVIKSIKVQKPFILTYPNCQASKSIYDVTKRLLQTVDDEKTTEILDDVRPNFLNKFLSLIKK